MRGGMEKSDIDGIVGVFNTAIDSSREVPEYRVGSIT